MRRVSSSSSSSSSRSTLWSALVALGMFGVVIGGSRDAAAAGPYAPAAGAAGSTAIASSSSQIKAWATGAQDYVYGPNVDPTWRNTANALGPAEGNAFDIVALGDNGSITLTFDRPIGDGAGFDFAIFENSFNDTFLELAWVEVSADGTHFRRFNNDSLTLDPVPFIGGSVDPANIDGLAGKYRQGYGTPFDLADVGLNFATHVRIVDIVGDESAHDTTGDVIYDPYPTIGSGGFDLDAAAVLHEFNNLAGDADLDGDVDLSDLGALASHYGQTANVTWSRGDFDLDNDVDLADLGALASNYGAGAQQALSDFQSLTSVPEPAIALFAMCFAAGLVVLRRASSRHAQQIGRARHDGYGESRWRILRLGVSTLAMILAMSFSTYAFAQVADFEDVIVPTGGYDNGSDGAGGFASGGISFDNVYDNTYQSWYGFAASNVSDTTTPGYGNQYASITGGGAGGAGNYAVGFDPLGGGYGSPPRIELNQTAAVEGLFITNVTYTYLAIADGDDGNATPFVRQFGDDPNVPGGGNQGQPDYYRLTIIGKDAGDQTIGSVDVYLADYRFADNADDFVLDQWRWIDLSSLGDVASLEFSATSTDQSFGYLNTPAYFAIDNLTIAPEPASAMVWMLFCAAIPLRRNARGSLSP